MVSNCIGSENCNIASQVYILYVQREDPKDPNNPQYWLSGFCSEFNRRTVRLKEKTSSRPSGLEYCSRLIKCLLYFYRDSKPLLFFLLRSCEQFPIRQARLCGKLRLLTFDSTIVYLSLPAVRILVSSMYHVAQWAMRQSYEQQLL